MPARIVATLPQGHAKARRRIARRFRCPAHAPIRAGFMSFASAPSTFRAELAATLRLAGPLAGANLLQMLIAATDVIFIARLGAKPLAASSLAIAVYGLVLWSLSGMTGAVAALIAEEVGAKRHAVRQVRRSSRMGLWLAIGCGLVGMLASLAVIPAARITGQDPEVARLSASFVAILAFAMVPMLVANVLRNFVSALGRPLFATLITAAMIGVNAFGNWLLVFGNLGMPALGLRGSAISTVLTGCGFAACYVVAIARDRRLRRYYLWGNFWRPEWTMLRKLVQIGLPISVTILAEAGIFTAAAFMMGALGPLPLAAHTLALQIAALAFQLPFGIGQAATIRVGYHFGARNPVAIGRAGWAAIAAAMGCMLVTASAMMFAPLVLLHIYIDPAAPENAALVRLASGYLIIAAGFQLADGMQAVAMGSLRGLQDTRVPMGFALFGYWVPGLATCLWLGFRTPLGGTGVWFGLALGLFVVALLMLQRWIRRERLGLLPA
jgi:MATE family multidrug resistance protein